MWERSLLVDGVDLSSVLSTQPLQGKCRWVQECGNRIDAVVQASKIWGGLKVPKRMIKK